MKLEASIFKAYDIRGIVGKTITEEVAYAIGQGLATMLHEKGLRNMVIGRDGRLSGLKLQNALSAGLNSCGIDVIDIGMVTTPIAYFATQIPFIINGDKREAKSCVAITGSHNPPEYNGFKIVIDGKAIFGEEIQSLYQLIAKENFKKDSGDKEKIGTIIHHDIQQQYFEYILADIKLNRPLKVIVDAGNGIAGAFAPTLYQALGCEVKTLYCEVDGTFPNHHPDPAQPENLLALQQALARNEGEIGLAFDGDGDRLGVVTQDGQIIYPDRQLMLFAADVLTRYPKANIIYDVKCSRHLTSWIKSKGGQPLMHCTGHSLIKQKLRETGAPLGGEMSGHIFFKDRWFGFDDGIYAGARLLEILSKVNNPSEVLNALPASLSTPELQIDCHEHDNKMIIKHILEQAHFPLANEIITIDGLRVEYGDGFGLVRASNTVPVLILRFEAESEQALKRIQAEFTENLKAVLPFAVLPY